MQLTKHQRNRVYKLAFERHLDDVQLSIDYDEKLYGMCQHLRASIVQLFGGNPEISDLVDILPEFATLKPKNKSKHEYWWIRKNKSKTRIIKFKQLIEMTKP